MKLQSMNLLDFYYLYSLVQLYNLPSKVAKEAGAKVFERFNKDQRGKGYALEWMFDKIYKMDEKFDAYPFPL